MSGIVMPQNGFVSGKMGAAYATIDDRRYKLFMIKDFKSKAKIDSEKVDILGTVQSLNRPGAVETTWSASVYECTDIFNDIIIKYINTGVMTYFDLMIVNDDPNSAAGKKTTIHKNCMLSEATLSQLDVSKTIMETEISGSFSGIERESKYNVLEGM